MTDSELSSGEPVEHRVIFFGDSICVGQGISIHKSWVARVAANIGAMSVPSGGELVIVNASVNGNTTRQALERMPYDVQSHGVMLLFVQFGMNDCNYWLTDRGSPRVSPKAFGANLEEIVGRGIRFGARRVFVNTNHPTTRDSAPIPGTNLTYEASNRLYNQIIRDVVSYSDDRVILNDVERYFWAAAGGDRNNLGQFLLRDGLHLNERGHDLYCSLISPMVEQVVRFILDSEKL